MIGKLSGKFAGVGNSRFIKRRLAASAWLYALLSLAIAQAVCAEDDLASQLKRATEYHDQSDYAHSIPILRKIVQESPRNYQANLLLGEDLFHSGAAQDAIAPLEMACRLQPHDAVAELYLADAAASSNNFPVAAEALQAGIARSGGSERFLEAWASYCLERYRLLGLTLRTTKRGKAVAGRVEAASHAEGSAVRESLLEQSAAVDPEQPGIWGELGIAQLELRKHAEALESLKTAQRHMQQDGAAQDHVSPDTDTLQLEALLAAVDRNWPKAEQRLRTLAARSPTELRNALLLWRHVLSPASTRGATQPSEALQNCLRAVETCPLASTPSAEGKGFTAKDLYAEGRWEKLIALPRPGLDDDTAWLWQGVAFARTGDCARAIPSLERGLKIDEFAAGFWLEVCYSNEAEHAASRLKAGKDEAAFHQLRGDVLLRMQGDAAAARVQYEEALKSRPEDPSLLDRLAEAYMRLGDAENARRAAQKALAIDPHRVEALRTLASLSMSGRDYDQALRWLRQLIADAPSDAAARVQLGSALAHTGNAAEALSYLAPALDAGYPDERGALHAIEARVLRELGRNTEAEKAAAEAQRLASASQFRSQAHDTDPTYGKPDEH